MKINVSVELDWLDEEGSIDDEVKHQLIIGVKNAISQQCMSDIKKRASAEVDKALNAAIESAKHLVEQRALAFADDWLEKEVTIKDKWGDDQECLNVKDLVKRQFDNVLQRKVDSQGRFTTSSYDAKGTALDWLLGERVRELVGSKLKDMSKELDAAITKEVNNGIKANVSNKFAEMVVQTASENQKALTQQ